MKNEEIRWEMREMNLFFRPHSLLSDYPTHIYTHVYLSIPSCSLVQIITDLSADPDANFDPSCDHASA